jgi:hypothetical protein
MSEQGDNTKGKRGRRPKGKEAHQYEIKIGKTEWVMGNFPCTCYYDERVEFFRIERVSERVCVNEMMQYELIIKYNSMRLIIIGRERK